MLEIIRIGEAPASQTLPVMEAYLEGGIQTYPGLTNPAVGASGTVIATVPAGYLWEFVSLEADLSLDATGSARIPTLQIDDGSSIKLQLPGSASAQALSSTCRYRWLRDGVTTVVSGTTPNQEAAAFYPPWVKLFAGYKLRLALRGIGVGDDFAPLALLVHEYKLR
jgi:hypothetical protein